MKFFRRKKKTNVVFLSVVVLLGTGAALFMLKEVVKPPVAESPLLVAVLPSRMARLTLDFGDGKSREFRGEVPPATSVLDALSYAAGAGDVVVEYAQAGTGITVQRIDGKHNGVRNKRWRLYINGQYTEGDPATHPVNPMDSIEWRYE